jgi:hypothetical protein
MPEITTARLADIPALCELLTLLFTQEEDFMPDLAKQTEGLRTKSSAWSTCSIP